VELTIDGRPVAVAPGTTVWEAARQSGIEIPVLCHDPGLRPVGVCRLCVVDTGGGALTASCVRACEPGMQVTTQSAELDTHRGMLTELLMSDQPSPETDAKQLGVGGNELFALAERYDAWGHKLRRGAERGSDPSSPVIAVDHQACILCDRCIRACDDVQSNEDRLRPRSADGGEHLRIVW
jgi:formate dehydrogenase major subunit